MWKKTELSPGKTSRTLEKQSYTRSYPQYAQKSTTSVVHEKRCQGRKFVLEFVIKSQKKGGRENGHPKNTFLDNIQKMHDLAVNTGKAGKERNYCNNEKNIRTIMIFFIKLYLLFWGFCGIIYSRGRREKELLHFCKTERNHRKRSWYL